MSQKTTSVKSEERGEVHVPEKNAWMWCSLELKGSPLMRTTPLLLSTLLATLGAGWLAVPAAAAASAAADRMVSASPSDTSYTEDNTCVQLWRAQVFLSSTPFLSKSVLDQMHQFMHEYAKTISAN